jgi:hypothetical protein
LASRYAVGFADDILLNPASLTDVVAREAFPDFLIAHKNWLKTL